MWGHSFWFGEFESETDANGDTLTMRYDGNYGRVKAYTYASGITVGYDYDDYGYQTKVYNAKSGYEYQKVEQRDALLNITEAYKNANSLRETRVYSEATGQLRNIYTHTSSGEHLKHNLGYVYGSFGNLSIQEQWSPSGVSTESYGYDKLHRLINSSRSGFASDQASMTYEYDAVGNITHKSDYATTLDYTGSGGPNAVSSITKLDGSVVNITYDANGNMRTGDSKSITYNAFNKPVTINAGGVTSTFNYGADLARYKQVKGTETTLYIGKEVDITLKGNTTTTKTYIDDIAIVSKTETAGKMVPDHKIRFIHRDRLGSVMTLTNHENTIMEQRSYDAFGKPRTGEMKDPLAPTLQGALSDTPYAMDVVTDIDRGFTDHEHLDDAQLIHMNGRAYDYNLGRFLSVDPFIQAPGNSQSMNPYSYIMNNPLAGTDPSGYMAECEQALGKGCGDEPKPERRDRRKGKGFGWQVAWTNNSGKHHVFTATNNGKTVTVAVTTKTDMEVEDLESLKVKDIDSMVTVTGEEIGAFQFSSGGTDNNSSDRYSVHSFSGAGQKLGRLMTQQEKDDFKLTVSEAISKVHYKYLALIGEAANNKEYEDIYDYMQAKNGLIHAERIYDLDNYGPNDAEMQFATSDVNSLYPKSKLYIFRGAYDTYLYGSPAAGGSYHVNLPSGMNGMVGLITHESGHAVYWRNFRPNKALKPKSYRERKADDWVKKIWPGKY